MIRVGQRLKIPGRSEVAGSTAKATTFGDADSSASSVRVRPGETLSHIARRHGVTVEALQHQNRITDPASLRAGKILEIPGRTPAKVTTHRVGKGQTLSDIAVLYRTTVGALQARNGIKDPTKLRTGQVIEVPM